MTLLPKLEDNEEMSTVSCTTVIKKASLSVQEKLFRKSIEYGPVLKKVRALQLYLVSYSLKKSNKQLLLEILRDRMPLAA